MSEVFMISTRVDFRKNSGSTEALDAFNFASSALPAMFEYVNIAPEMVRADLRAIHSSLQGTEESLLPGAERLRTE